MVFRLDLNIKFANLIIFFFKFSNYILFNYFSYYDIPVNKIRKLINAIDNNKTEFDFLPFISKELRDLLEIP